MKLLILGIGQSNFLDQLYGDVKKTDSSYQFFLDNYYNISNPESQEIPRIYNKKLDLKSNQISRFNLYFFAIKFAFSLLAIQVLFFEIKQKKSLKEIKNVFIQFVLAKYRYVNYIKPLNFDLYHFHYCIPKFLIYAFFIPKKSKMIMSFWGSDLMRNQNDYNSFYVKKALERAKVITVQTPEMEEMVVEKHGNVLRTKLRSLRFTINTSIYKHITELTLNESICNEFKAKYLSNTNKIVVALGHNAHEANNHLKMIDSIKKMPQEYIDKCVFLLHLGYGKQEDYVAELKKKVKENDTISFLLLEDYFGPENIALLRINTNILIQAPISDALSGAMTEILYAGNTIIAGDWLPYGILKRNNIKYYTFNNFEALGSTLKTGIDNLENNRIEFAKNRIEIENLLFPKVTTKEWINLFETV